MQTTIKQLLPICFLLFSNVLLAQNPGSKIMGHEVFDLWKDIESPQLSNDGQWVAYQVEPGEGDGELKLWHASNQKEYTFPRGHKAHFSADNQYLIFAIQAHRDTLLAQRRRKVEEEELPKDSLAILRLADQQIEKIPQLHKFKVPKKWSGHIAYQLYPADSMTKDSSQTDSLKTKNEDLKEASTDNGFDLVIRKLGANQADTLPFIKDYTLAEEGPRLMAYSTGDDSTFLEGIYFYDCTKQTTKALWRGKGDYQQLSLDQQGRQAAFIADIDTSEARIRPFQLFYWQEKMDSATISLGTKSPMLLDAWRLSEHADLTFSKTGDQLYFSIQAPPILADTTLLPEEIVNVEVWSYLDKQLYTQQETLLEQEQKKAYRCVLHTKEGQIIRLGQEDLPEIRVAQEASMPYVLGYNDRPYLEKISWDGFPSYKDIYAIDIRTAETHQVARMKKANPRISPSAQYLYWFDRIDTVWQTYQLATKITQTISHNEQVAFYDELNDRPMLPSAYGIAGWTQADESVLVYDRYDIWQMDPKGQQAPKRLTKGREQQITYRYIKLDTEQPFIDPNGQLLLHLFNHQTKHSGYAQLSLPSGQLTTLLTGPYYYTPRPMKAQEANALVFTQEDFQTFPDLQYTRMDFKQAQRISEANPQQKEYAWGSMEAYTWTAPDGQLMQGQLVKPPNFDPTKKYPMIVNFYERSSNRIHRHRTPKPHRSTINYSFYANRGYLIFNPDVYYRVGYPGESALHAVVSGVGSLIDKGFVERERIALQGHSWGGYQIAYILTKTNMFRCAESGAPVVNMISAYGGIRWGSGLSRMFQYEQTQSRIGGTLWEYPLRYIENSPIFFADKIETPVLILHNDEDGAVPWYQGIEFFVAMRRLGKKAWMLNYNDEPHWPVKRQNRKDFNKRMQEFFDHYLKDAPMPSWMQRGVPAIEKGIYQGLLSEDPED